MSNPKRSICHNELASMEPLFAEHCCFDNPQLHNAHGKWSLGIMILSNSSVSEQTKMRSLQHANMKTHVQYQRVTQANNEKKYEAMNPLLLLD